LALTDSRTGLLNPRGFEEVANHEWERAERELNRISLVLVDLDLLRDVNNTHGHRAGDAVIAAVGRILSSSSRSSDAVARLGGEEFALLLPDTDLKTATMVGERLREMVAGTRIDTPSGPLAVTVSCGVATRVGTETMEALFDRADTALYDAKNGGRNRVSVAGVNEPSTVVGRR
jgi:diguanylate cyclase (GGDEF)-like protein